MLPRDMSPMEFDSTPKKRSVVVPTWLREETTDAEYGESSSSSSSSSSYSWRNYGVLMLLAVVVLNFLFFIGGTASSMDERYTKDVEKKKNTLFSSLKGMNENDDYNPIVYDDDVPFVDDDATDDDVTVKPSSSSSSSSSASSSRRHTNSYDYAAHDHVAANNTEWPVHDGRKFVLNEPGTKSAPPKHVFVHERNVRNFHGHYVHDPRTAPLANALYDEEELPEGSSSAQEDADKRTRLDGYRKRYGEWAFVDTKGTDAGATERPAVEDWSKWPNRDAPSSAFPQGSWQTDPEYVDAFLDEAVALVTRVRNAVYAEYAHGGEIRKDHDPDAPFDPEKPKYDPKWTDEEIAKDHMNTVPVDEESYPKTKTWEGGGNAWIVKEGRDELVRKLLHAMMTNDDFHVVQAGHSAAAGHGNNFLYTQMMVFHDLMEPVFDKLGVNLVTRNMAMGGLGTLQSCLGGSSIYGEHDLLFWDSSMTEKGNPSLDSFSRFSMLSGERVPVIMFRGYASLYRDLSIRQELQQSFWHGEVNNHAHQDFLSLSDNKAADEEWNKMPYFLRGLRCEKEWKACKREKYNGTCWIKRKDFSPVAKQMGGGRVPGQAGWHPGWRVHRYVGRSWALFVMDALLSALELWKNTKVYPLPDEHWHVGDVYDRIREKLETGDSKTQCEEAYAFLPRICRVRVQAATEFTPRADPYGSSLRRWMVPAPNGYLPHLAAEKGLYAGPDLAIPGSKIPFDEVDAHDVATLSTPEASEHSRRTKELRRRRRRRLFAERKNEGREEKVEERSEPDRRRLDSVVVPGRGWAMAEVPSGFCDGSAQSECKRDEKFNCLLYQHNDSHGAIVGDGLSGWAVFRLDGVREGIVMIRIETWHGPNKNPMTEGWTEENDGKTMDTTPYNETAADRRRLEVPRDDGDASSFDERRRNLKGAAPPLPDDLKFDIAINGEIKSTWDKATFEANKHDVSYNNVAMVLLDDPTIKDRHPEKGSGETVEVAVRFSGGGRGGSYYISHMYWA